MNLLEVQKYEWFSLAKLCSFTKFAKLSPAKHSRYMVYSLF